MILMLDFLSEPAFIAINVDLFFDNSDVQLEKNGLEKDIIDLINIEDNNYFIVV